MLLKRSASEKLKLIYNHFGFAYALTTFVNKVLTKIFRFKPYFDIEVLLPFADRECSHCGYQGAFKPFGRPPRIDALCPSCGSLERHRLFALALKRGEIAPTFFDEKRVLHFAAERHTRELVSVRASTYQTADLFQPADLKLDMEEIDLPDKSVDTVIANHVLEHVNDTVAAGELHRILDDGGVLIASVPIIEGWADTYENDAITSEVERDLHFGQGDHVRYYGADFRDRILKGGFSRLEEFTASGDDVIRYGLMRGDKFFIFHK